MKKLFFLALAFLSADIATAQTNTFPSTGFVGIGTTSPVVPLDITHQYAQIRLMGANSSWLNSDIIISRNNSGSQLGRSPNIVFYDIATSAASYIQSYLGNLQFFPGGVQALTMTPSGLVGVNTATPVSTFQVNTNGTKLSMGSANSSVLQGTSYIGFNAGRRADNNWQFDGNIGGDGGALMYSDISGNLNFATVPTLNGSAYFYLNDTQLKSYISLQLTSAGVLRAKQIKVETTGWPDFVFSKTYKLPSLESVKTYIDKNHHLPDFPSAKEVESDGQDLGAMNKLLLKKVEELTLYMIEKDKEIKDLKNSQQTQIDELKTQIRLVKKSITK